MNINELSKFNRMFEGICEYYGKQASPMLAEIYWRGLQAYDYSEVSRAFDSHVRNPDTGQFMPKIADVERHLHGNTNTRAMQAWLRVAKALQIVGTYETVKFDDPLIHACIEDMGGWPEMGKITNDDLPFKIREFEKRYQAYLQVPPTRTPQRELIGVYDMTNKNMGYTYYRDPILISDVEKREDILRLSVAGGQESGAPKLALDAATQAVGGH